jgi:hypothetical protein
MAAKAIQRSMLDAFRREWVCGHLDYQRAAEALEAARRDAASKRAAAIDPIADDAVRSADAVVEEAHRRLGEIEAILAEVFDRFCGLAHAR